MPRWILLACGDVEPNPGPGQSSEDGTELQNGAADSLLQAHNNQTFFDCLHADMAHTMNQAVSRMETATQQQGKKIEERLGSVEDKIDRRLCEAETRQTQLADCMDSLHSECQALRSDNQDLRGTVNYLTEKCDYMENQSRRNNLVFTGFASVKEGFESWEDCERKVKACVKACIGHHGEVGDPAGTQSGKSHRRSIIVLQAENVGADKCAQAEDLQRLRQHLRQRRLFGNCPEETSSTDDFTEKTEANSLLRIRCTPTISSTTES